MNTELLLKVKAAILAEPLKFDMCWWFLESDDSPCGTAACIAGHAVAIDQKFKTLKRGLKMNDEVESLAKNALMLTEVQSFRLFGVGYWPPEFEQKYFVANTPQEMAKVAADRIDHFIATDGEE